MPEIWYRALYRFVSSLYYARITIINPERRPAPGPVLYLGLHRNGAVDGFVYKQVFPGAVFMISTQLLRTWFTRLIFTGIAVARAKDKADSSDNQAAMRQCREHLQSGGQLFIFPEGTSDLGPRHLPFKSGAAWLVQDYLASGGPPLTVVPVGIHYECPWGFRSKVEVVLGEPISPDLPPGSAPLERVKKLRRQIATGLESIGVNVPTADYQDQIQQLAYISTLATPLSYYGSLKKLEMEIPQPIVVEAGKIEPELESRRLLRHQGVPLFPMASRWLYLTALLVFGPIVLAGIALNLPPFLAGWYAGKKFPDGKNVIALWRVLVGVPVLVVWMLIMTLGLVFTVNPLLVLAYAGVTWAALVLYYRVKKLAVAVHNGFRHPELRSRMLAFRETVLRELQPDKHPLKAERGTHK